MLWGLGHLAIGDRRGLLLAIAHPLAVAGTIALAALLIDGTRWMLVLPAILVLLVFWLGQALNAHRAAVALGAKPGGELQVAAFLPLVVAVVSAFWLLGGQDGSPQTTLRRYVDAWEDGRPDGASGLFAQPMAPADVASRWALDASYLSTRVDAAARQYGPTSGIDPALPFNSLRFTEVPSSSTETARVSVEIVRRQRVETVLLGFIPTATQQTVVVEQLGTVSLRSIAAEPPAWLPVRTGGRVWRIESVDLSAPG